MKHLGTNDQAVAILVGLGLLEAASRVPAAVGRRRLEVGVHHGVVAPRVGAREPRAVAGHVVVGQPHDLLSPDAPDLLVLFDVGAEQREAARTIAMHHGAELEARGDGTLLATIAGGASATDLAPQGARCALALRGALGTAPIAEGAGMDGALVRDLLAGDADRTLIEDQAERARDSGITGVPSFVLNGKLLVVGAQPPAALAS